MGFNPDFEPFKLPEEYHELREAIRGLAERDIAPYAQDVDENERFPEEALKALNESGFNAIHVPEDCGGQGADSLAAVIVIEEIARVCGSSSLIPAVNKLGTMGLILNGSDELKQEVLPDIVNGELASYALTEREAGSDAGAMKTRAVREGDEWVINGSKCFITNGGRSSWYTVMAVTDPDAGARGISAFMVHKDDPGFRVGGLEHKLGIKGSPTAELYFEDCRVPASRMVGEEGTGFKTALQTLDHTRPTIGAQALGIAEGALDETVAYVKERKQFGRSIAAFQNTQFELAEMKARVDAAKYLVYAAAQKKQAAMDGAKVRYSVEAAEAKLIASRTASDVTRRCLQLFGGYGYTRDYPIERMMRDAKITEIYEGTSEVQMMVISGAMLK